MQVHLRLTLQKRILVFSFFLNFQNFSWIYANHDLAPENLLMLLIRCPIDFSDKVFSGW